MYILLDFSCNEVTENQEPKLYIFQKLIINRNVSIGSNFSHPLHWVVPFFFRWKDKKNGLCFFPGLEPKHMGALENRVNHHPRVSNKVVVQTTKAKIAFFSLTIHSWVWLLCLCIKEWVSQLIRYVLLVHFKLNTLKLKITKDEWRDEL